MRKFLVFFCLNLGTSRTQKTLTFSFVHVLQRHWRLNHRVTDIYLTLKISIRSREVSRNQFTLHRVGQGKYLIVACDKDVNQD